MTGKDWLLLFLAEPVGTSGHVIPIDPIRIMKGMFYFTRKVEGLYEFEPYHLGPICFQIYDDLRSLLQERMIAIEEVPFQTWKKYYPTTKGMSRVDELRETADSDELKELKNSKDTICLLGFLDLLRKVYKDYPKFASKSVFNFE